MKLLRPDWPAPPSVQACVTTRSDGVSQGDFLGLNLGDHVEDAAAAVAENRARLRAHLALGEEPRWLQQVHGTRVLNLDRGADDRRADAAFTRVPGRICAVLTADCLPVLFCDRAGTLAAAAHAGWRGLADGVLEATVAAVPVAPETLLAYLGPAIGPTAFEVGDEVRERFLADDPGAENAFVAHDDRWLADLYQLARRRLARVGVEAVYGGGLCTYRDEQRFFSFRRDGRTGRMASLIWLQGA